MSVFGDIVHGVFNPVWAIAEGAKSNSKAESLQQENDALKQQVQQQLDALNGTADPSAASGSKTTGNSGASPTSSNSTILIGVAVVMILLIVLIFLKRK